MTKHTIQMNKPTKIWFLVWPDGKVVEKSQTSISKSHAIKNAIKTWWLIPDYFPDLELGELGYSGALLAAIWKSMEKGGFKCYEIDVNASGVD